MACFASCCQRSCCRQSISKKNPPRVYDSLSDASQCTVLPATEMSTVPCYQQPTPVQCQSTFDVPVSNTDLVHRHQRAYGPVRSRVRGTRAYPSLKVSLHYDAQKRTLVARLLSISGLLSVKDEQGIFISATVPPLKDEVRSNVIPGALHSTINQTMEFFLESGVPQRLNISVFSATDTKLVGQFSLPLEHLQSGNSPTVHTMDIGLRDKVEESEIEERGELMFSLCYNELTKSIQGIVLKAKNLPTRASIMPDPYIKVVLSFEGTVRSTWKSTCKCKSSSPVYNEPFHLDLTGLDLEHTILQVDVIDHNKVFPNHLIGCVIVGFAAPTSLGRKHWRSATKEHQGQTISYWHSLVAKQ